MVTHSAYLPPASPHSPRTFILYPTLNLRTTAPSPTRSARNVGWRAPSTTDSATGKLLPGAHWEPIDATSWRAVFLSRPSVYARNLHSASSVQVTESWGTRPPFLSQTADSFCSLMHYRMRIWHVAIQGDLRTTVSRIRKSSRVTSIPNIYAFVSTG